MAPNFWHLKIANTYLFFMKYVFSRKKITVDMQLYYFDIIECMQCQK